MGSCSTAGGKGSTLLVFGGQRMGTVSSVGMQLSQGGLWSIDLAARPSKLLRLTLQKAFGSNSPAPRKLSEDVLKTIFSFAMGRLMDVIELI